MIGSLKRSLIINFLFTIIVSILAFITNKFFAESLGAEKLGLMRLFTQLIAYLNLADMGIGMATSYSLYKPLIERDCKKISKILSTISYFYKKIALIIFLVGMLLNFILLKLIKINDSYIYLYWSLYVINTSISYTYAKYPILFTANQEYDKVKVIQSSAKIIFQVLQIIALLKIKSFLVFVILMNLENVYLYIMYKIYYVKHYNYIKKIKELDKNIIKDTKDLFWHKLAGVLVFNTDYIIISKFISLKIVGVYSSYLLLGQVLNTFISIGTTILTPIIGKYIVENTKDITYKKCVEIYIYYIYISIILITCTYYLIFPFIKLWLGEEYIISNITLLLILFNFFIQMTRNSIEIFKVGYGFFDDTYVPFLEGVLNLFFSLILVNLLGLNGVILGTLISNIAIVLLLKPILIFQRCFEKTYKDYLRIVGKYLFITLLDISIIHFLIKYILKINFNNIIHWFNWIYKGIYIMFIVGVVTTIIFLLDKKFRNILKGNIIG